MQELQWNGHANFQLTTPSVTILVDPFFDGNPSATKSWKDVKPDAVFITHDHFDHTGSAVEICKATGAKLGAIVGTATKLMKAGIPQAQILNGNGFNIGGTITVEGVSVTMTQAYHSSESGTPAGYIFRLDDGYTVYHAGDTGIFSEMELWGRLYDIDLALLPIGGVYTMDAKQAALACSLLKCKSVLPMHWGTFPVLEQNTKNFAYQLQNYAPDCRLYQLKPGESLKLENTTAEACKC